MKKKKFLKYDEEMTKTIEFAKFGEKHNPIIKDVVLDKDTFFDVNLVHGGLQFVFKAKKGEESKDNPRLASVIHHLGSYGREQGLFEIMSQYPPESWGDSVKGHLTFMQCLKYIRPGIENLE